VSISSRALIIILFINLKHKSGRAFNSPTYNLRRSSSLCRPIAEEDEYNVVGAEVIMIIEAHSTQRSIIINAHITLTPFYALQEEEVLRHETRKERREKSINIFI